MKAIDEVYGFLLSWERPMAFWVYVLENPQGRFYIGHTDNLERHLPEYNPKRKSGPNTLIRRVPGNVFGRKSTPTGPAPCGGKSERNNEISIFSIDFSQVTDNFDIKTMGRGK